MNGTDVLNNKIKATNQFGLLETDISSFYLADNGNIDKIGNLISRDISAGDYYLYNDLNDLINTDASPKWNTIKKDLVYGSGNYNNLFFDDKFFKNRFTSLRYNEKTCVLSIYLLKYGICIIRSASLT